jgi:CheY-like chemotaxis protein
MLKDLGTNCDICTDLELAEQLYRERDYSHIFFDRAAREAFRDFYLNGNLNRKFFVIKEVTEKNDKEVPNALSRPVIVTQLAAAINGRKNYEPRRTREDGGSILVRNVLVLVVDDNRINRMVAEGLLQRYGAEVHTAPGGEEALEMVQKQNYDLVFMDHMMPGMDGIETARKIRSMGNQFSRLTIIALTANALSGVRDMFLREGLDDFLPKPIMVQELKDILAKYLPSDKIVR